MRTWRRALVTGATSGIGLAFAQQLPPTTHLLLCARNQEKLAEVAATLARPGRDVEVHAADLTREEDRDGLVARAEAVGIDLLVNNAGSGRIGAFLGGPADAERGTTLLNVVAVVDLTRRLLPGMLQRARADGRRCGLIVVSSTAAFAPVPFFATYAATKAFALHLTEAIAEELRGEPIDVLAVCPGATRTEFPIRAGYPAWNIPGTSEPGDVAAEALRAIGREGIRVTGRVNQAALGPLVCPRRLLTGALGLAMRVLVGRAAT